PTNFARNILSWLRNWTLSSAPGQSVRAISFPVVWALVASSGRPIAQVARDLGVSDASLGHWIKQARGQTSLTTAAPNDEDAKMAEENKRLRKRITELEVEREILKRATAFWVKESNG
ncbi:MAG: transposase, partial [Acidimicrobiales bacterium]